MLHVLRFVQILNQIGVNTWGPLLFLLHPISLFLGQVEFVLSFLLPPCLNVWSTYAALAFSLQAIGTEIPMLELLYSWCVTVTVMLLDYVLVLLTHVFEGLASSLELGQQHRDDGSSESHMHPYSLLLLSIE